MAVSERDRRGVAGRSGLATSDGRCPHRVVVWVCTVAVGMLLRKATSAGVAASFVVVASAATALLLLGWRAALLLSARKPN